MQITIDEQDIRAAVEAHVRSIIAIQPNQAIEMEFTNSRGDKGITATLTLNARLSASADAATAVATTVAPPAVAAAPATAPASKAEPEKLSVVEEDTSSDAEEADAPTEAPAETAGRKSIFAKAS